jgi:hypothetical protein
MMSHNDLSLSHVYLVIWPCMEFLRVYCDFALLDSDQIFSGVWSRDLYSYLLESYQSLPSLWCFHNLAPYLRRQVTFQLSFRYCPRNPVRHYSEPSRSHPSIEAPSSSASLHPHPRYHHFHFHLSLLQPLF